MNMFAMAKELREKLLTINPVPAKTPVTLREWFHVEALPYIKDQALSELMRTNQVRPKLLGFGPKSGPGIVDLDDTFRQLGADGWGDVFSRNATARVQKMAAMVPGTIAVSTMFEAWFATTNIDDKDAPLPVDNPDRRECLMINMVSYNWDKNEMYQLVTMIEIIKVLGPAQETSPHLWRETKFGPSPSTNDPMDEQAEIKLKGRFVVSDPEHGT